MADDYYNQGEPRPYTTKDGEISVTILQPTERQLTKINQVAMAEVPKSKLHQMVRNSRARSSGAEGVDAELDVDVLVEVALSQMGVPEWKEFAAKKYITEIKRKDGTAYMHKGKEITTGEDLVEYAPRDYVTELVDELMAESQMSAEEKKSSGDSSSSKATPPSNGTAESVTSTTSSPNAEAANPEIIPPAAT